MRKIPVGLVCLAVCSLIASTAVAAPSRPTGTRGPTGPTRPARVSAPASDGTETRGSDDLPSPLETKRRALRRQGLEMVLSGQATPVERNGSTVVQVASGVDSAGTAGASPKGSKDQYVELARETTDKIFVVLVEFGNQRHPDYPDQDTDPATPGPTTFEGPLHDRIPSPDPKYDNTTVWQKHFDRKHFQDLYFASRGDSVRTYYEGQSSGRYSVDGTVSDWVKVPYNEARYGRSDGYPCGDTVCSNTWALVRDGVNAWETQQRAAGRSEADIAAELATYDQWDRYDHDYDGDFNEPDGYLDHFQVVHAGGDQADGDPQQGEDAVWSHRWYAYSSDVGLTGPAANPLGGTEVGDTGLWVGDYTVQPENGGLSVFTHEYGHDLGLPDDYDTSGGDNSLEYWTLMAQSRLNAPGEPLGTRAGDLGAWNKLKLGWLDYAYLDAGDQATVNLGPSEYNTAKPQALIVGLPDKPVTRDYGPPYAGSHMWWSDSGDNLTTSLTRALDLTGVTSASVDLKARFDIEMDYDYLYVQASTDDGGSWTTLDGTVDGSPFIRDGSDTPAISDSSGDAWLDVHVPLDSVVGGPVLFRFLYRTDGGVAPDGFFADEIVVTADGAPVLTDGAESGLNGWTADGFRITSGTESADYPNYYLAASRSYLANDKYLKTGPYNFGFPDRPNYVEHYAYQTGLLLTYLDTSQPDNNTNEHPGEGMNLVIDSRPAPMANACGGRWRTRIQVYDAPFSRSRAGSMTLHCSGLASRVNGLAGQPVFDDRATWWYPEQPEHGVKVPVNGVRIEVVDQRGTSTAVRVSVAAP